MERIEKARSLDADEKGPGPSLEKVGFGTWLTLARVSVHPVRASCLSCWVPSSPGALNTPSVPMSSFSRSWPSLAVLAATHFAGEYHDFPEDAISSGLMSVDEAGGDARGADGSIRRKLRNKFSGGSGILLSGRIPREKALLAARIAVAAAAALGLIIYFGLKTGPLTIPFGAVGILCGYFYSTPPLRWVERGLGEAIIAFAYGWLPIACSFYLMAGKLAPEAIWLGLPIGLTIFNVIIINEYPDHDADRAVGKRNLVVRCGKRRSVMFYVLGALGYCATFVLASVKLGLPGWTLIAEVPVILISMTVAAMMTAGRFQDPRTLEAMCGLTIMVNLASNAVLIAAYLF